MKQTPIKIIVTGANGQLGSELKKWENNKAFKMIFTDLPELDLTDKLLVNNFIESVKPDFLINCAAYTAVDRAETDKETAKKINVTAVDYIAAACEKNNVILFHISTDFVFPGNTAIPLKEDDKTDPVNFYGFSKLEGEYRALKNSYKSLIIRTSWLYSQYGQNFLKSILRKADEKGEIKVVFDQAGTPTYAYDLADAIIELIVKIHSGSYDIEKFRGIYHYSNEGIASWYDFALSIFRFIKSDKILIPILTYNYPAPARRPAYSVLDKSKIKKNFGLIIPHWQDSLEKCITGMK